MVGAVSGVGTALLLWIVSTLVPGLAAQAAGLSEDFAGFKTTSFLVIFAFFSSSAGVTRRYSVLDAILDISEDFLGGSTAF